MFLKSEACDGLFKGDQYQAVDPELSPLGIDYLMNHSGIKCDDVHFNLCENLNLQLRILATSDSIWKSAIYENKDDFLWAENAPGCDDGFYAGASELCHYGSLSFKPDDIEEMSSEEIIKYFIDYLFLSKKMDVKDTADSILKHGLLPYSNSTMILGEHIYEKNHLYDNGLDNFVSFPNVGIVYQIVKADDSYLVRFFLVKDDIDYEANEAYETQIEEIFLRCLNRDLPHFKMLAEEEPEEISSVITDGTVSDVKAKLTLLLATDKSN